jgi:SHS family lactate transporter-like MFS transporter
MALGTESSTTSESGVGGWRLAVSSGIAGWVLDAFDFFVVVFLFDALAKQYGAPKVWIVSTLTLTLATRPVGAVLFGFLGDRFGRRRPLIFCVLYFSFFTVMSGLSPNLATFMVCRALYGIGMGGYWGISASYAMESCPTRFRGVLSGLIQAGYPIGYLLAAIAAQTVVPQFGWRTAFLCGLPVAILVVVLMVFAPESKAWKQHRPETGRVMLRSALEHKGTFLYLLLMMTVLLFLSHGAQDLYPDFLNGIAAVRAGTVLGMKALAVIPIVYNIGAIAGALVFGYISQSTGRRKAMLLALVVALASIPTWAFGSSVVLLMASSFLMQCGVQGAFGVIPAHLNELSPDRVRSVFAGTVYQLGSLLASPSTTVEFILRDRFGYPVALAAFEAVTIVLMLVVIWFGPEASNRSFMTASEHS